MENRRVFPKDLTRLFYSALSLSPDKIGAIKVLDNYSFLDIETSYAEKAIKELNGTEYRGRNITVNMARKREN